MALTKLTKNLIDGTFGTEWVSTIQTSNFTAEAAKGYFVNTTAGAITVNLPAGVVGTEIIIQDYAGTFATNDVIFTANGSEKIQGVTDSFNCVTNNATVTIIYQDATKGWTADNISTTNVPLTVEYLVVAGGGSGGGANTGTQQFGGGAGGAGGYRTNYAGTALSLNVATNYTVTVGAGASGVFGYNDGNSGSSSEFNSITAAGGGGGGHDTGPSGRPGVSGGSGGGGASAGGAGGNGNTPPTTPSQGNNGGQDSTPNGIGGGGGGAGAGGYSDGTGGVGLENNIIGGTGNFYAGGGGGGIYSNSQTAGVGGSGGGGNGAIFGGAGSSGTNNKGGGGGGGSSNNGNSGSGGSGIVILRYPNSFTISGLSGTTTTVGTDKVTTFTTGTGTIQFN